MSTHYKHNDIIPVPVIVGRLRELAKAVTAGRESVAREFTMRIPAERDHDADLVLSEAATMLEQLAQVQVVDNAGVCRFLACLRESVTRDGYVLSYAAVADGLGGPAP